MITPKKPVSRRQRVALLTDGRMSGASGKVLAAIHVTPEALSAGGIARLRDGDVVRIDAEAGLMEAQVAADAWALREPALPDTRANAQGCGRELFGLMRGHTGDAEHGACSLFDAGSGA